ncbi:PREDICTED: LOW QUALITY PROTEIN: tumor necrosis factor alpha-induced protein 2 [Galeopterus variegatus]|uniref:LOW QUALITY PROTEIN: tumor necrosis factor alpha-induced protein 2 n=1 Tax=Galeopterus variegatus TaxID=482537 RepID=A0ABM0RL50_GALVR|nr:PREDICTED: LOW QUALITY PROTEIN: tumor necrosis factor alpha-induced protein 2 [Galeopterus variegatus]
MLKVTTFFQGLPGQRPVPGSLDVPGSPQKLPSMAEADSEASMSEASSEDLVPPLEAGRAPQRDEQEASKRKEKKPRGLANMLSVFTKGKKKTTKAQTPSSAEPECGPECGWASDGPLPTVEELKAALERGRLEAARPLLLWRRGVAEVVEERMSRRPAAGTEGRSEAESAFLHMGLTMKEDLEAVVERLKPLFPAEFDVVATYAERYHEHFAAHLATMAQFELCERDTYMLLVWVQNFYPNDIINSPKLAQELQSVRLGSLLPPKQIQLLEATFLSNEAANVKELMARALELESQRWAKDVAPQRLDGHCHSELAIDIIQIISQGQAKAESITPDLGMQIKQVLLVELAAFLRSYQRTFDEFLERSKQLRNYRANIIANVNNCLSFRTYMEQKWQIPQYPPSHLLGPLNELKSHGFDTLLQNLFVELKPLFKRFTQTRWAAPEETLEEIIAAVGGRLPEFLELQDCFREELMEVVHLHLVKEYIIRLSKRRLVLKTAEQQQQLARHILANADVIQHFCIQNGSPATWLHSALPTLAEIIRLQDPSAIKIEVATYATSYPDFGENKGHLGT